MGAAVVVATRSQARQPVGVGPLPYPGGRHAGARARYVRALLSDGLRCQGRQLRRHVHGRHSLEQCGAAARSSGAIGSKQEDLVMRVVQIFAICALAMAATAANAQEIDWKKVDEAIGRSAAVSGDVHRYGFPRTDLTVTLDGVTIKPALALGGWAAFKPAHGGAMVMGD